MIDKTTHNGRSYTVPKVSRDGTAEAIFLAFLATAGLFYVNLGGAFLSAFVDGLGISRESAGYITSANKYGAAFGALFATFLVKNVPWRRSAFLTLVALISVDLVSFFLTDVTTLVLVRFTHGSIGGFLVGLGFSIIAKTRSPDRVFGMLVAIQYTFGSIAIFTVPKLVESFGPGAAFGALILFSLVTMTMLPFIPTYSNDEDVALNTDDQEPPAPALSRGLLFPASLALTALFLFQTSNMGVADYVIELGKDQGYSIGYLSNLLTAANVVAISGALLVYFLGTRFGRAVPILLGTLIAGSFTFLFHWSQIESLFFIANAITGVTWAFTVPYLLGLCATFDKHGRVVVFAGFISKMGLASGPLIGAMVVGDGNFTTIINLATAGLLLCGAFATWAEVSAKKFADR